MKEMEVVEFLKKNIEPLTKKSYGSGYMASVTMADRTFFPCVIFHIYTLQEIIDGVREHREYVTEEMKKKYNKEFVPQKTVEEMAAEKISKYKSDPIKLADIIKVEKSRFAFPPAIIEKVCCGGKMCGADFVAKMKDGKYFGFHTVFTVNFFEMPDGYCGEDIIEIINDRKVDEKSNEISIVRYYSEYEPAAPNV